MIKNKPRDSLFGKAFNFFKSWPQKQQQDLVALKTTTGFFSNKIKFKK